ncbi:OLC1v1035083C1 [Oldenlandia corymbosa var. corymbosa]|uniref:OLC1v1035083C1 n=1 Tax=Oldenlandia corymbosa var. corymbosa TaxID=529605 RepID=A0AAV1CSW5_OLDCO|nr:OLC1v1035083C1 [Oldenlandia corymbosa var. corymbosa]
MDAMNPASASLALRPGRRSISEGRSYHGPKGVQQVKGLTFDKAEQVAGHGAKLTSSYSNAYFPETQNSSNMNDEEIVYTIDYHGATTHPTPTPKHPGPTTHPTPTPTHP